MFAADLLGQYFTLLKCCNSLLSLYVFSQRLPEKLMFEKYIHQDSVICLVWRVLELKQHSNMEAAGTVIGTFCIYIYTNRCQYKPEDNFQTGLCNI